MRHILNKMLWLIALAGAFWCIPSTGRAQNGEPIAVLKSSIYDTYGETNSFQILIGGIESGDYIEIDCGSGTEEHELEQAVYDPSTSSWSGTLITCNVSKEGTVKIYGNASNIDVLHASGCYLRSADISKLTNLVFLDLSHNELEALDLTGFTKLQALYVDDNPFNVKPLIVGSNKPDLTILEMGQMNGLDESFNLSDYPNLLSFNAWANKGLKKLNPTGCPGLMRISIDSTPVSELDVSKNTNLQILNISDTGIKSIDLSKNTFLQEFYCDHLSGTINTDTKLTSLDVTKNTNLVRLYASGNALTAIDVSKNTYLQDLYVDRNKLTTIDVSQNRNLIKLSLRYNNMTFATLPLPGEWNVYDYVQNDMPVARTFKEGMEIDLSDKVLREGTKTTVGLFMTSEENPNSLAPLGEEYYTYADGKITLLKATPDSVYLAFANDAFPASALTYYPLCTNKFIVKTAENYGKDDKVLSFMPVAQPGGVPVSFKLGMNGATDEHPKTFYVDYGDGKKVEYKATSSSAPEAPNVSGGINAGGNVTVYVPEGELVTAFDMENITLSTIDLGAARALGTLRLANTGLYGIDLGWNRYLTKLELTGNHFSTLNLRGKNDAYQKNLLHDINLSNNEMTSVTLNDNFTIHHLDLSNNKLTELSLKDADMMKTLDISNNKISTLDINYCTLMTSLNIAGNEISSITLPSENSLTSLHCENNNFTFATLPNLTGLSDYVYAPQKDIIISAIGPGVDLSEQNVGGNTAYVWKKTGGTLLTKGTDYTEDGGKTRFLSPIIGQQVYCEMTNSAFSGLTMKTSSIEAAGMPTNVVATFITTADQAASLTLRATKAKTPVYIDWKGDEVELEQYIVGTSPETFSVNTHKGAVVRVYSYNTASDLDVFSISGVLMSSLDVSKLTQLVCLTVNGAGLSEIKMPESKDLFEIYLDNNNFSEIDLTKYAATLKSLTINKNKLTTFDASLYPNLEQLALGNNQLTSVKLDNKNLWTLTLSGNKLTSVDLANVPALYQFFISNNELTSIDVSGLKSLKVLYIDRNKFKFSTLPPNNNYSRYIYANQAELAVGPDGDKVDLSSEAMIDGKATVYRWFVDTPAFDENGELTGEELYIEEEYTLDNGVTTFVKPIDNVMCVLINETYPDLILYTPLMNIKTTGVDNVTTGGSDVAVKVEGGNILISSPKDVAVRLYSVSGTLVGSAEVVNGGCVIPNVNPGVYVVTVGGSACKVVVR